MQALGQGRERIHPDFWVRLWEREAARHALVVADDVRYPNEAAAIRAAGGMIVRIARAGAGSATGAAHVSERGDLEPDCTILNDCGLRALREKVDRLLG